jgi:hypothetical protein
MTRYNDDQAAGSRADWACYSARSWSAAWKPVRTRG